MSASSDTMLFSPIGSSGINRYMTRLQEDKGDSHQQHSRIKLVRGQPGLLSAVEREGESLVWLMRYFGTSSCCLIVCSIQLILLSEQILKI